MLPDWQNLAVLAIVALSTAYLARAGWATLWARRKSKCGSGCGSCSSQSTEQANGVAVPLDLLRESARKR
jgi:hypothetical protein